MDFLVCRRCLKILIGLSTVLYSCLIPVGAQGQQLELFEQKIKAGLVYNLLKYTTWPEDTESRNKLQLCLLGGDAFDGYLFPLEGRTAQQALIVLDNVKNVNEVTDCSIIIISRSHEDNLPELIQFLKNKHILTISDIEQFSKRGGMVELAKEGEKINLYINKKAVEDAGLNIQDRMLRLAKLVSG